MISLNVSSLPVVVSQGKLYRASHIKYDPLSGLGAFRTGGRWNPRFSFPTIYLSSSANAVRNEVFRHNLDEKPERDFRDWVVYEIQTQNLRLVNISDGASSKAVRHKVYSNGQVWGQALGQTIYEQLPQVHGILAPSRVQADARTVALFADRVQENLQVVDSTPF